MATKIQIKRTSVAGRTPNTADPANTSYIAAGELAVNLTDEKLYSSNGSVAFEVGANLSNLAISSSATIGNSTVNTTINSTAIAVTSIYANGTNGSNGQVLTSNGTSIYWGVAGAGSTSSQATYTYSISSNTTLIEGPDDNSAILSYTAGNESVFLNGVKLIAVTDYAQTNSSAITLTSNATNGDVVEIVSIITTSFLQDLEDPVDYLSSNTDILTIDTFNISNYRTAKYILQANTSDSYHSTEALVIHDGTTAYISEYGFIYSNGSLFDLSADISGSELRLRVTPTRSGTIFKYKRIILEV